MPYHLNWQDTEQTILIISSDDTVTWEGYHAVNEQALQEIMANDRRIDLIIESKVGVPAGNPLPHFRKVIERWNGVSNLHLIVVVNSSRMNGFVKAAAEIASKLLRMSMPNYVKTVETIDQALALIAEDRRVKSGAAEKARPQSRG